MRTLSLLVLASSGCSGPKPMRVWGEVTFEGNPIDRGNIVFVPIDDTPGPTTGGDIIAGQYEVPQKIGPWRGGTYLIEITALKKNGQFLPNPVDPQGPPVELADNYIPTKYNHQSELRVTIADEPDKNQFDFVLKE